VITVVVGGAAVLIAVGVIGLFAMMLVTSTLSYRRGVFRNANPRWDDHVEGEMAYDGVRIRQEGGESFFRWDWFEGAVVGRQVLVLIPALNPNHPLVISAAMLTDFADADRIPQLVNDLTASLHGTSETRQYDNGSLLRSSLRRRSRSVPVEAIPFEGRVTSEDLRALPEPMLRRERPIRAYLVLSSLLFFPALLLIGLGQFSGLRLVLVAFIVIAAASLVAKVMLGRYRVRRAGGQTVFYVTAFADQAGITSDFQVTVTTVPWQCMQGAYADETQITLSRAAGQVIIARSDMFASDESWQDFRDLVKQQLKRPESPAATSRH
jgi:hypothetical protein